MPEFKSFKDFYSGPDSKTTELTKEQREAKKKAEKEFCGSSFPG